MSDWSAFLKDVRIDAPGVAEPLAEHAVRRAAQRFCDLTRAWVVELDPTITREGVLEYDLELDQGAELVRLESAKLNGQDYAIWRAGNDPQGPYVYTPDGKLILFSRPVSAGLPLVLRCSVKPGNEASGIDDAIYDRYCDVIAKGAVARLTKDPTKAMEFEAECGRIKHQLWRGNAAIRPRARACFF